jgi:hypothetical protein
MQWNVSRPSYLRPVVLALPLALALALALPGIAPRAAAQGAPVERVAEATVPEHLSQPGESARCQDGLAVLTAGLVNCRWCDLDNCGCIAIDGCTLFYSCGCSPIDCWHSCQNKFCTE